MKFTPNDDLNEFVKPTKYCDSDSVEVKNMAEQIAGDTGSPQDAALNVFNFVRDTYKFGLTPPDQKASETLKGNIGWCVNKTNLQVAMLRALGIPARYHQVAVTKQSLKGIISKSLYQVVDEPIWYHPWCECFINNKWTACDLFIDGDTYGAAIKAGYFEVDFFPTIDWDGRNDLIIVNHWLIKDAGTHISYDDIIDKVAGELKAKPKFILKWLANSSNRHTAKLRDVYAQTLT
jgi:hypothetical protein